MPKVVTRPAYKTLILRGLIIMSAKSATWEADPRTRDCLGGPTFSVIGASFARCVAVGKLPLFAQSHIEFFGLIKSKRANARGMAAIDGFRLLLFSFTHFALSCVGFGDELTHFFWLLQSNVDGHLKA